MNHKAQFDVARKTIFWMIAGFIIAVVILALSYTLASYENKLNYVPPQVKAEFIALRFTHIPECFAHQDLETVRVYPNIIDIKKFTKERLSSCYSTDAEKGFNDFNFRLELKNKKLSIFTNNYFNKDDFTLFKEVLVYDGKEYSKDTLIIYVQEYISAPQKEIVPNG